MSLLSIYDYVNVAKSCYIFMACFIRMIVTLFIFNCVCLICSFFKWMNKPEVTSSCK